MDPPPRSQWLAKVCRVPWYRVKLESPTLVSASSYGAYSVVGRTKVVARPGRPATRRVARPDEEPPPACLGAVGGQDGRQRLQERHDAALVVLEGRKAAVFICWRTRMRRAGRSTPAQSSPSTSPGRSPPSGPMVDATLTGSGSFWKTFLTTACDSRTACCAGRSSGGRGAVSRSARCARGSWGRGLAPPGQRRTTSGGAGSGRPVAGLSMAANLTSTNSRMAAASNWRGAASPRRA